MVTQKFFLKKKKSKGNGVPTTTYAKGFRRPPTALVQTAEGNDDLDIVRHFLKNARLTIGGGELVIGSNLTTGGE